jgi:hypothetical protein
MGRESEGNLKGICVGEVGGEGRGEVRRSETGGEWRGKVRRGETVPVCSSENTIKPVDR